MRLITFSKDVKMDDGMEPCRKGKRYIVSDGMFQQFKENFADGTIDGVFPFQEVPEKRYNGQDLTGKTLLVWRTGGMGDLCFITPNLRYIKETYKDSKIHFGCGPRFRYGVMHHPNIDKLVPLPIDYELLEKADYYLMFEGIIENNEQAKHTNAYDLFEAAFGFTGKISLEKKRPVLGISPDHLKVAKKMFSDFRKKDADGQDIPIIGIGLKASHIIRSIIPPHIHQMMGILIQNGVMVALIGGQEDKDIGNMLPLAGHPMVLQCYKHSKDYRDTIAHISQLDGLIGPDSSPIHMAAAFEKPVVGVYGPFPSALRMKYYKNASGFDAKPMCSPCFLHGIETCDYSDSHSKEPMCQHMHNPELIVKEMLLLLHYTSTQASPQPMALKQL